MKIHFFKQELSSKNLKNFNQVRKNSFVKVLRKWLKNKNE